MVDFMELVRTRQSVRKYAPTPISRESILRCLEAARLSPSACNSQPWSFIVVEKKEIRERFVNEVFSGMYSLNTFVKDAPVFVVVVTQRPGLAIRLGGILRGIQVSLIDIGIACEHFVLAATELGIGTCWLGWFNERAAKRILGLPRSKKIDIIISMGYSQDNSPSDKKRKTLEEISRFI